VPLHACLCHSSTDLSLDLSDKRPEDSNYTVNVLTRCVVNKEMGAKKSMKIVPLNEHGEPLVVSVPLSEVTTVSYIFNFQK